MSGRGGGGERVGEGAEEGEGGGEVGGKVVEEGGVRGCVCVDRNGGVGGHVLGEFVAGRAG